MLRTEKEIQTIVDKHSQETDVVNCEVYKCDFMPAHEIAELEKSANSQNARIMRYLLDNQNKVNADATAQLGTEIVGMFSATQIWQAVKKEREEVNAFRRSLANLSDTERLGGSLIFRTSQKFKGYYGKTEHLWTLTERGKKEL